MREHLGEACWRSFVAYAEARYKEHFGGRRKPPRLGSRAAEQAADGDGNQKRPTPSRAGPAACIASAGGLAADVGSRLRARLQ
jgi:hypothetical protein